MKKARLAVIIIIGAILILIASVWAFHWRILTPEQMWFVYKPDGIPANVKSGYLDMAGEYKGAPAEPIIMKCIKDPTTYWVIEPGFVINGVDNYYYAADGRFIGAIFGTDVGTPKPLIDLSDFQCDMVAP